MVLEYKRGDNLWAICEWLAASVPIRRFAFKVEQRMFLFMSRSVFIRKFVQVLCVAKPCNGLASNKKQIAPVCKKVSDFPPKLAGN